jgi:hypothetical protein
VTTGTSLVPLKQALVALLAARPGLAAVQVSYDYPMPAPESKAIWLAGAEADLGTPVMRAGRVKMQEDYTVTLIAQVLMQQGEGQEAADLAALVLLQEIQQELADHPQPTPEVMWALLKSWAHSVGPFGDASGGNVSRGSRFEIRIGVRARLI